MDQASYHAYLHSFATYPRRWFERKTSLFVLSLAVFLPLHYLLETSQLLPNTVLSLIGLALYLMGFAADTASTQYVFSQKPIFDKHDLFFPVAETGAFLPLAPSLKHHLLSVNALVAILIAPFSFLYPSLGVAVFASRIAATVANLRHHKRLSLTLEMTKDTTSV